MNLQTKALYNLFRLNVQEESDSTVEPWAIEDLRLLSLDQLFARLAGLGLDLDKRRFASFAEPCDSPEELMDILCEEGEDPKKNDPIYLVVFELWRRLIPEKQPLSIFCDELDHRIFLYDRDLLESDEPIQDALANLKEILDENIDAGAKPFELFEGISHFCAHDIEGFLYDYVSELLDSDNTIYATELVDEFTPFLAEPVWFDFLRARITSVTDPARANAQIASILDRHPKMDAVFLFEIIRFLAVSGEHPLFIALVQKILSQMETEEEFQELMEITADYYRRRDKDDVESAIERIMKKRQANSSSVFSLADPDLRTFAKSLV